MIRRSTQTQTAAASGGGSNAVPPSFRTAGDRGRHRAAVRLAPVGRFSSWLAEDYEGR